MSRFTRMIRNVMGRPSVCLPFGHRSAPIIFSAVADALEFIIRRKGVEEIGHYLDDFIVLGPPGSSLCQSYLDKSLETCDEVGFPVADGKMEGPATVIPFLGIEVDTDKLELRLTNLIDLVSKWRKRKSCTKRELQSLAGHLANACKVVRPGRRFLRGVFGLMRADLEWWHVYLVEWNGVSMRVGSGLGW